MQKKPMHIKKVRNPLLQSKENPLSNMRSQILAEHETMSKPPQGRMQNQIDKDYFSLNAPVTLPNLQSKPNPPLEERLSLRNLKIAS